MCVDMDVGVYVLFVCVGVDVSVFLCAFVCVQLMNVVCRQRALISIKCVVMVLKIL